MVNVIKATGEIEPFSEDKLKISIQRAGIPKHLRDETLAHVKESLYENIPTSEIYKHIVEFLDTSNPTERAKYSLKQAIMQLGPTGYPFEDYVAEILTSMGYTTKVRSLLTGKCVNHEIDVIAQKGEENIMIEAKFHNSSGIKTDVHVPLYTKSRFEDLRDKYKFTKAWIITNTKITADALSFSMCENMKITSWSYPDNESLRDLIDKSGLHPITALSSLSLEQKQRLLENHTVLARDIIKKPDLLSLLDLPNDKRDRVIQEIKIICKV